MNPFPTNTTRTSERNRFAEDVTTGRDILGDFTPEFAELNDNVLFGQVWAREKQLSPRDRSVVAVTALMALGVLDTSLRAHAEIAKNNGITHGEVVEILTHTAFYVGQPKTWTAFHYAKEIYVEQIFTVLQHSTPF